MFGAGVEFVVAAAELPAAGAGRCSLRLSGRPYGRTSDMAGFSGVRDPLVGSEPAREPLVERLPVKITQ
jgi:hypothetical protein